MARPASRVNRAAMPADSIAAVFSLEHTVSRYLEFECVLARVQAELGLIPQQDAVDICDCLRDASVDYAALRAATEKSGYPIAPLIRQLTSQCGAAGRSLHWGATTQDLLITVRAQQVNASLRLMVPQLARLGEQVASLASMYRASPMPSRCFGGHAGITTFGLRCSTWLSSLARTANRLNDLLQRPMEGELFGASGTLMAMGDAGLQVQLRVLGRLGLQARYASASSARDACLDVALYLVLTASVLAKIAQDVAELSSTEIGELAEPETGGRDTSSTLPHKANPILSWLVMNGAEQVQAQVSLVLRSSRQNLDRSGQGMVEHAALPAAFIQMEMCLRTTRQLLEGLRVDTKRMRSNCDLTEGLALSERIQMALAPHVGRLAAHDLLHAICRQVRDCGESFAERLMKHDEVRAHLSENTLRDLLDPSCSIGLAPEIVDRTVAQASDDFARLAQRTGAYDETQ